MLLNSSYFIISTIQIFSQTKSLPFLFTNGYFFEINLFRENQIDVLPHLIYHYKISVR